MAAKTIEYSKCVNPAFILNLADEVLLNKVFSRLEFPDLQRTVHVCKKFNQIPDNGELRKFLFEKDFPKQVPIPNPAVSWKDQYKYAYLLESNLRSKKCHLSQHLQVHEKSIVHVKKCREYLITGSAHANTVIISHEGSPHRLVFKEASKGQFCTSGDDLFYASRNQLIILKKIFNGKEVFETQSLTIDANDIDKFYVEGGIVYAKTQSGTMQVWQKDSEGNFKKSLAQENIHDFYLNGDQLFLATDQDTIEIWKAAGSKTDFEQIQILKEVGTGEFNISELSFEKGLLIAGSFDGSFKVWKMDKEGTFRSLQTHEGKELNFLNTVTTHVVKDDYMILGCLKGQLLIFKKDEGGTFHPIQMLPAHGDRINSVQFQCGRLLTASTDGKAKIWLLDEEGKFKEIHSWSWDGNAATCAEIDGSCFITGYSDGSLEIRDFRV